MRLLFGIVLGAALTIGGAWMVDQRRIGNLDGPLVNWNTVEKGWTDVRDGARFHLRRITG